MKPRFKKWKKPPVRDGRPTRWNWVVRHPKKFRLGHGTDIGAFTYINAENGVTVEDYAQVGSHCSIYSVSTIDGKKGPVAIGRNCKVGSHSVIMPSVTIGENTVVGAMSFVNKSLPANCVAYGVPARVVRKVKTGTLKRR